MKIGFPALEANGLQSRICGHFGRSPWFLVVDQATREVTTIENANKAHAHGECGPMDDIAKAGATVLLCQGIGAGAISSLVESGVVVMHTDATTVEEALDNYEQGQLEMVRPAGTCGCHGDCHELGKHLIVK